MFDTLMSEVQAMYDTLETYSHRIDDLHGEVCAYAGQQVPDSAAESNVLEVTHRLRELLDAIDNAATEANCITDDLRYHKTHGLNV